MKKKSTLRSVKNNYLKHFKNQKGITLIALVVTIIVLLILAGVVINQALGENGLIGMAKMATEKYLVYADDYHLNINGEIDGKKVEVFT